MDLWAMMKRTYFLIVLLVSLLILALFLNYYPFVKTPPKSDHQNLYVGVDVAHNDLAGIKSLVDEISSYTNLLVIGSTGITYNVTELTETCQYAYDRNMFFIFYTWTPQQPSQQWLEEAKNKWGDRFLGLYIYDEVGGKQLDGYKGGTVQEANNYTDAKNQYVTTVNNYLNYVSGQPNSMDLPWFTSDYALYWFDYEAGYDTVFAEFGWNYSRQLNVALCRGAATVQNKDWGIMITWTYTDPPYLESGEQLYNDMVLAYNNGAKYIIVFDSNANHTQGILQEEHLQAMQQFWQYVKDNPRTNSPAADRVAFVLVDDYAYGFRGPNDTIWGLWEADNFTYQLCVNLNVTMQQYGSKLDVIYDDPRFPNYRNIYGTAMFWNGAVYGE
jgi:hypothetical protein